MTPGVIFLEKENITSLYNSQCSTFCSYGGSIIPLSMGYADSIVY